MPKLLSFDTKNEELDTFPSRQSKLQPAGKDVNVSRNPDKTYRHDEHPLAVKGKAILEKPVNKTETPEE